MIDPEPGLGLPLVNHLVQQGMLHLAPGMPRDVTPADGDIDGLAGPDLNRELTQPGAHAARKPDRDIPQSAAEVLRVEPPMQALQPVEQRNISRPGALSPFGSRRGWRVRLHRKCQELALGQLPQRPRHSRIEEPGNRLKYPIRRKSIAPMNPKHALIEAQHDGSVGMGEYPFDIVEAEGLEPNRETVFESRGLPRCHSP
jgi:hypothetical protein